MTMSFVAGLSGGPAYSPTTLWAPLCKSQNPGWHGLGPEKAQDPHVQLPQDSLPAAHSIQGPQGSVPLALPSTTGSLPKNRLQDASSLCPTARPHQRAGDTEKPQAGLGLQDCPVQQGERQVLWGSLGTAVKRTQQPRHVLAGSSGTHGWFPAHCARRCG